MSGGGGPSHQEIVSLLENTLSPDAGARHSAESSLEQFAQAQFPAYVHSLSLVLSDNSGSTPSHIRNAAGLLVKNALSAREGARAEGLAARWRETLDDGTKNQLKQAILQTLASNDRNARNVSGQVIAAVAAIELPNGAWNDLIPTLLQGVNQQENTGLRQASLQAIGYVCEGIVSHARACEEAGRGRPRSSPIRGLPGHSCAFTNPLSPYIRMIARRVNSTG
jgi:importin subunit beta-1